MIHEVLIAREIGILSELKDLRDRNLLCPPLILLRLKKYLQSGLK